MIGLHLGPLRGSFCDALWHLPLKGVGQEQFGTIVIGRDTATEDVLDLGAVLHDEFDPAGLVLSTDLPDPGFAVGDGDDTGDDVAFLGNDFTGLDGGNKFAWVTDFSLESLPDLGTRQDGFGACRVNGGGDGEVHGGESGHCVGAAGCKV